MKPLVSSRRGRLLLRVALYGGALLVGLPLAFAHVMTRTYRLEAPSRPPLGYEEVSLLSEGLHLRAWVAPGEPERAAFVIVHGLGDSIESYQEHARPLRARGHAVILPDLRGHGASEGRYTTLGGREREDVRAAMRFLREHGRARSGIALLGHSAGAVAALRAAVGEPDVRAVIVEAPYDTYRATVARHARLIYGLPEWVPLIPLSIAFAEWRAGFNADEVDAVAAARGIRAPLLAIVDGADPRMPEEVVRRVFAAHPGPKRLWVAAGVDHVGALFHPDYWKVVLSFLEENGV